MNTWQRAAMAALLFVPVAIFAQDEKTDDEKATDEIVVVGRSIATTSTRIEVEREMILDSASVLKDIPGANVNSNGLITGIAQYRGMYGDRVAVDIDRDRVGRGALDRVGRLAGVRVHGGHGRHRNLR